MLVAAVQATFDEDYPVEDFRPDGDGRGVYVSIEYPAERANYPGIWVQFVPTAPFQTAGLDHKEVVEFEGAEVLVRRFRYAGRVQLTAGAMTSLECDRLVDELVKVLAFGREQAGRSDFKAALEDNDLIEIQVNWDQVELETPGAAPGTPWGTDEVVYETTISFGCQGSFVGDPASQELVPLSAVVVYEAPTGEEYPPAAGGGGWI